MKMNSKFSLALIALVGVGVFALPATTALFSGQHSFYNIDATGNQIPCTKCHGDVKAELSSNGNSLTGTPGPHANFKCEYCHRAEAGGAYGDDAFVMEGYVDANESNNTQELWLVTTIFNHQIGNFPKVINYTAGMTVDNWFGNVFNFACSHEGQTNCNTQGSPWTNDSRLEGAYPGNLGPGTPGIQYLAHDRREVSLHNTTVAVLDNTTTMGNAFNPRLVTWDSSQRPNLTGAGSREVTPGTRYHAASLVSCLECHGGDMAKGVPGNYIYDSEPYNHRTWLIDATDPTSTCSNCHYSSSPATTGVTDEINAGGFGLTGGKYSAFDTGATEAHNDFVRATNGTLRYGYGVANDACVACHTHVAVDINFQKKYALKFDANAFTGGNGGNNTHGTWGVGGFSAVGTVNVEEFGNQSGITFATGNHSYNWTVGSNLYIVDANGTNMTLKVQGLVNDANDSQAALISP